MFFNKMTPIKQVEKEYEGGPHGLFKGIHALLTEVIRTATF